MSEIVLRINRNRRLPIVTMESGELQRVSGGTFTVSDLKRVVEQMEADAADHTLCPYHRSMLSTAATELRRSFNQTTTKLAQITVAQ